MDSKTTDKPTMVRLIAVVKGEKKIDRKFEIAHATRILRRPNNGGWELPEDSEYTFSKVDGINRKAQGQPKGQPKASTAK